MNTIDWLTRLISFDTTSHRSNLLLIYDIQAYLKSFQIPSILTYDDNKQKANLFATIGEASEGGLILSGHTDVVPVEGQSWETNPFEAVIKNNNIYGRGSSDMKGFIAVVLALLPTFLNMKLKKSLHLAFSYDEEIGCLGAPLIIKDFRKYNILPAACIVGEPTGCQPVIAHKGIQLFKCQIKGKSAHSSLTPEGCNAIEFAADLICWLNQLANEIKNSYGADKKFDVPFTTLTTNVIHGGIASNIIPSTCEFIFEFRNLPQLNPLIITEKIDEYIKETLVPKMQLKFDNATVSYKEIARVPGFEAAKNSIMSRVAKDCFPNIPFHKVSYATEAGLFEQAGISTLVCGPGFISEAHKPNEFISLSQLHQYESTIIQLIEKFQHLIY